MNASEVAAILKEMATLLELSGAKDFEAMAYRNGAEHLAEWRENLRATVDAERVTEIPRIGKGLARVITELVRTGGSEDHRRLLAAVPKGLLDVTLVEGLGPKKVRVLHQELGVDGLDALEAAAESQRIRALKGFGAKSEEKILAGIDRARARRERRDRRS